MRRILFIICCLSITIYSIKADWVQVNNGLTQLNVNALTSYTSGGVNYIFAGTLWGLQSGIFLSTNNGSTWNLVLSLNTDVWSLANTQSGGVNYIYAGCANSFYRSTNNGLNWDNLILPNGSHWYYAVAANGNIVFAGCKWWSNDPGGIYKSTNFGANWVQTLSGPQINAVIINNNNIFAGAGGGANLIVGVFKSTDIGSIWNQMTFPNTTVRSLTINGSSIFAGTSSEGVFVSTNNGVNWTQTSLNNYTIYSLISFDNVLFAAGAGVWVSTDNGSNWNARVEGLGGFARSLNISNGYIFTGTDGSGVYRRSLGELVGVKPISGEVPNAYKLEQNFPNPFNPNTVISYSIVKAENVEIKIYDLLGKEILTLVNEFKNPGSYNVMFNAQNLSSGVYFYRIRSGSFTDIKKMTLVK